MSAMNSKVVRRAHISREGSCNFRPRRSRQLRLNTMETVMCRELKLYASDYNAAGTFAITPRSDTSMHIKRQIHALQRVLSRLSVSDRTMKIAYPAVAYMIFEFLANERKAFLSEGSFFVPGRGRDTERITSFAQTMMGVLINKRTQAGDGYHKFNIAEAFDPDFKLCPLVSTVYQTLLSIFLYKNLTSLIPPNNEPGTIADYAKEWNRQLQKALYASK